MNVRTILQTGAIALAAMAVVSPSYAKEKKYAGQSVVINYKGEPKQDAIFMYLQDGDLTQAVTLPIEPDASGVFTISDAKVPAEGINATITLDDYGYFGIYAKPGTTSEIFITQNPDKKGYTVKFEGENAAINNFLNAFTQAFDLMRYSPQDAPESFTFPKRYKLLDSEYKRVKSYLLKIKDKALRQQMSELTEASHNRMLCVIMEDEAYKNGSKPQLNPKFMELVENVDPNSDANLESAMTHLWLGQKLKTPFEDAIGQAKEKMEIINKYITSPKAKKVLTNMVGYSFFGYGQPSRAQAEDFMKVYKEFAKDYPNMIQYYASLTDNIRDIKTGAPLEVVPMLNTPDGKTVSLSDLKGKVLYIDLWATWCGPCVKEIPHMEKLYEEMKDVAGLQFVSISADSNVEAWKKKLAKDNPQWAQFIFAPGESNKFMESLNITGIPRFLIIDAEGNLLVPDAPRPSESGVKQALLDALK